MAYIGKQPTVGNFQVCDAITVVNGQAAYTMQVNSSNVEPESANQVIICLVDSGPTFEMLGHFQKNVPQLVNC